MQRFILTGAPGAGKTVLIEALERLGHPVVREAATDVIAIEQARGIDRPWEHPGFIDTIATLQVQRLAAPATGAVQFHDRSLICTAALAEHLGFPVPASLERAIDASRLQFDNRVFFVRLLGFITPTAARRISYDESRRFEALHEAVYRHYGYQLEYIEPADIETRIARIQTAI